MNIMKQSWEMIAFLKEKIFKKKPELDQDLEFKKVNADRDVMLAKAILLQNFDCETQMGICFSEICSYTDNTIEMSTSKKLQIQNGEKFRIWTG